jgi:hypothetical protein
MPRPRIIKSHQYFDPRYKRVIYVVRDPRDVALSQFHFHRKRGLIEDGYPPERFVARFVAGETSPYGSWGENVAGWLATRQNRPGFLLLRYEDMLEDAARELNKVASFLEIPPNEERIANAVRRSAADEMRTCGLRPKTPERTFPLYAQPRLEAGGRGCHKAQWHTLKQHGDT